MKLINCILHSPKKCKLHRFVFKRYNLSILDDPDNLRQMETARHRQGRRARKLFYISTRLSLENCTTVSVYLTPDYRMLPPHSMHTYATLISYFVLLLSAKCKSTEMQALFPSLPDDVFESNNPRCNEDSKLYAEQKKNFTLWAFESK